MWSPSSMCGMTTPPSSRGMSPTTVSDVLHSASHLSGRIPSTPGQPNAFWSIKQNGSVCLASRMASGVIFVTGDGKWTLSPSTPSGSSPLPSLSEDMGQPAQNTSSTQAKVHWRIKHLPCYLLNSFREMFHVHVFMKMLFCLKLLMWFRRAKSWKKSHPEVLITMVRIFAEIYTFSFYLSDTLINMLCFCYF